MAYEPFRPKTVITVENLYTVHYFEYAKNFIFTGEKHDFWEMVYIDSGQVGVIAEGNGYTLGQGEVIFHKPMEYHNIWANRRYANVLIITFSSKSRAMSFFKNKILTADESDKTLLRLIMETAKETFAEPLDIVDLRCMTRRRGAPFGSEQMLRLYLEGLLIGMTRKNSAVPTEQRISPETAAANEDKIVRVIKDYLAEDLTRNVTLDDICALLCFSKTYIKSLFKKRTGTTIMQYFISIKLDAARRLIGEGELNFTEIAERCGFSSVHYFSRLFKAHTGMTPSSYSKSVRARMLL